MNVREIEKRLYKKKQEMIEKKRQEEKDYRNYIYNEYKTYKDEVDKAIDKIIEAINEDEDAWIIVNMGDYYPFINAVIYYLSKAGVKIETSNGKMDCYLEG